MGIVDALIASAVSVVAALAGIGLLFTGAVYSSGGSDILAGVFMLAGIVALVFAVKL